MQLFLNIFKTTTMSMVIFLVRTGILCTYLEQSSLITNNTINFCATKIIFITKKMIAVTGRPTHVN